MGILVLYSAFTSIISIALLIWGFSKLSVTFSISCLFALVLIITGFSILYLSAGFLLSFFLPSVHSNISIIFDKKYELHNKDFKFSEIDKPDFTFNNNTKKRRYNK